MPRGNLNARGVRGPHAKGAGRPRTRPYLSSAAARRLHLLAWLAYGRPTSQQETDHYLSRLIREEVARVVAAAPPAQPELLNRLLAIKEGDDA